MEENNESYQSKLTIRGVNIVYLLAMILFVTIGSIVQIKNFNIGILITEFVLIALPAFIYVIIKKGSIKQELRFNKLYMIDALLVTLIFCFGYPLAMFFNLIGNIFLSLFGSLIESPLPIAESMNEYFILLLIVAGSAGLCEEILFRGLIMRGYEKVGTWKSIIFTAVLFTLIHLNVQNVLGPLFLGIILGLVVSTTNSIFAGMLGHFVNNGISVTISFLLMQIPLIQEASKQNINQGEVLQSLVMALFFFAFVALITAPIMYFCIRALREVANERAVNRIEVSLSSQFDSLKAMLANYKISWPLYVSLFIFIVFSIFQFAYIITGKSLLSMLL